MTASEFAFLALGLILGVATGAALVEVLRARPSAAREIRVTVAPNSIHARRAATLADDAYPDAGAGPAAGGPGDRRWNDADVARTDAAGHGRRLEDTAVSGATSPESGSPMRTAVQAVALGRGGGLVAVPMSMEPDPITQALRTTAAKIAVAALTVSSAQRAAGSATGEAVRAATAREPDSSAAANGDTTVGDAPSATSGGGTTAAPPDSASGATTKEAGPCAEERRLADERCNVAARAREGAAGAAEALRVAQRTYDTHVGNAESAAAAIDPRSVRAAKEAAQKRFHDARSQATTRDDVEAAARTWLSEINEINHDTREAGQRIERDRAAAIALAPALERLAVEADAARISAERADEACLAAREAVAACDETRALEAAASVAVSAAAPITQSDRIAAALAAPEDEFEPGTPMASRAGDDALLLRILRGDRDAMLGAVARLSGDDPDARGQWQMWLSGLADALIARSIEASAFDFPLDHFFWGPFSQTQNRDIAAGLSSLGHRFDGFGGWVDERVPSQRDLSLAVGYAGLDPMRIRRWPTEAEMEELYAEVRVAADEYIADAAGGLTLGEMVTLLGRRADALTELWNEWGNVRPVLLAAG